MKLAEKLNREFGKKVNEANLDGQINNLLIEHDSMLDDLKEMVDVESVDNDKWYSVVKKHIDKMEKLGDKIADLMKKNTDGQLK